MNSNKLSKSDVLLLKEEGWDFDISSNIKWAKNSKNNSYIHGEFAISFLLEELEEIKIVKNGVSEDVKKVRTLQQQLDFYELKLVQTNPVIIEHKDGSLSQGNSAEWLLQHIMNVEQWPLFE